MKVIASTLNVRSGPGTDFRVLHQLRRDDIVKIKEMRGDWAWVILSATSCGGWANQAYLAPEVLGMEPPTQDGIKIVFGAPCAAACSAGRVTLPAPLKLGWENASVTRVACHILMVPVFTAVFAEIYAAGLWHLLRTFDGIYNCRLIKGSGDKSTSTHSWGISIDLNAATNLQGTDGDMDPRIVGIFESHGFYWGGRFSGNRRDEMHFEFVDRA